jgi:hypothetical protein
MKGIIRQLQEEEKCKMTKRLKIQRNHLKNINIKTCNNTKNYKITTNTTICTYKKPKQNLKKEKYIRGELTRPQ